MKSPAKPVFLYVILYVILYGRQPVKLVKEAILKHKKASANGKRFVDSHRSD
jgi:hypothetical protein